MSHLVLLLPTRARSGTPAPAAPDRGNALREWSYAFSADGLSVSQHGVATPLKLPTAQQVTVVVQPSDVTWVSAAVPKAPAHRLREVLAGLTEDQWLDDVDHMHLAWWPGTEGSGAWVAGLRKSWLVSELAQLKAAGIEVDRVVSECQPQATWLAHATLAAHGQVEVWCSGPMGVAALPLSWPGWSAQMNSWLARGEAEAGLEGVRPAEPEWRWTAEPEAATALRAAGVASFGMQAAADRLLAIARQHHNLLQFDLAPQHRGARWLLQSWARFTAPEAKGLRRGAAALLALNLLGVGVSGFTAHRQQEGVKADMVALFRSTFPTIPTVVDPAVQMERELQSLRQQAGQASPTDLETWLDVLAVQWPPGHPPLSAVKLTDKGLSLSASAWPDEVLQLLQAHAQQQRWTFNRQGNTVNLSRAEGGSR